MKNSFLEINEFVALMKHILKDLNFFNSKKTYNFSQNLNIIFI
jgi:hypothetical protein